MIYVGMVIGSLMTLIFIAVLAARSLRRKRKVQEAMFQEFTNQVTMSIVTAMTDGGVVTIDELIQDAIDKEDYETAAKLRDLKNKQSNK